MPAREGVIRVYTPGLAMKTVPSYRSNAAPNAAPKVLPGVMPRAPVSPHGTGAVALGQALALLTGRLLPVPPVASVAEVLAHARLLLSASTSSLAREQDASLLLAQCFDAVHTGSLVLLHWQPLPWQAPPSAPSASSATPAAPPRWMLLVGIEGPWHVLSGSALANASALLVLDATVPPVWGSGHNQHLVPGVCDAQALHANAHRTGMPRPVWSARTLDGERNCGLVLAAIVLQPGRHE